MAYQLPLELSTFSLVVTAGFLGSLHCAGMCGPFVGFYSMRAGKGTMHLAYHAGRLTSYLALGTLAGLLGQGLLQAAATWQLQRLLIIIMGVTMILSGIYAWLPAARKKHLPNLSPARWLAPLRRAGGPTAAAGLTGLCSALLPCGFLYSFVIAAGGSGHPGSGLVIMFGFWLGTLPALLWLGVIARFGSKKLLAGFSRLTPAFLILFGILALTGKWTAFPETPEAPPNCHSEAVVQPVDPSP